MTECWNGHAFSLDMGPGVRGICTVCPECGAGTKGTEDPYRRRIVHLAPELLVHAMRGKLVLGGEVVEHPLPDDAAIAVVAWEPPIVALVLTSSSWAPVNPGDRVPVIPSPVFKASTPPASSVPVVNVGKPSDVERLADHFARDRCQAMTQLVRGVFRFMRQIDDAGVEVRYLFVLTDGAEHLHWASDASAQDLRQIVTDVLAGDEHGKADLH